MNTTSPRRTCLGSYLHCGGLMLLVLAASTSLSRPARADHIDDALVEHSAELVRTLQHKGYHNVGVLKFMVKPGKRPASPNVGPMNLLMATRVENALIHGLDLSKSLGVIQNATKIASRSPHFTTRSTEGRAELFKHTYPLAWGDKHVSADAFLHGTVELSADMRTTTVNIDCIDKNGDKPQTILTFKVPTDRSILADSGQSYIVHPRSLKKKTRAMDLDQAAADSAAQGETGTSINQQAEGDSPINFEIRYNDVPQMLSQDPGSMGELRVNPPQLGDVVTFYMTNLSPNKIGTVVKVNGESTLSQDTAEDAACQKWVLLPNRPYSLRGFYWSNESRVAPFMVLNDDESAARLAEWSGSHARAGYIDVTVFTESDSDMSVEGNQDTVVGRSLRGLHPKRGYHRPSSAAEAQKHVRSLAHTLNADGKKRRGLVVANSNSEQVNLDRDDLRNPTATFQIQINYYQPGPN